MKTKPVGFLALLLILLPGAVDVVAAPSNNKPWVDRIEIISDPAAAEGCRVLGRIRTKLKKKYTHDQNLNRLKESSWGFRCDRILVTEDSWTPKHVEGTMFQCLIVRSVSSRSEVKDCELVGKVAKASSSGHAPSPWDGDVRRRSLDNGVNALSISQLEREAWEMGADCLLVLNLEATVGYGEAYRCATSDE